jgi:hypothetical protein
VHEGKHSKISTCAFASQGVLPMGRLNPRSRRLVGVDEHDVRGPVSYPKSPTIVRRTRRNLSGRVGLSTRLPCLRARSSRDSGRAGTTSPVTRTTKPAIGFFPIHSDHPASCRAPRPRPSATSAMHAAFSQPHATNQLALDQGRCELAQPTTEPIHFLSPRLGPTSKSRLLIPSRAPRELPAPPSTSTATRSRRDLAPPATTDSLCPHRSPCPPGSPHSPLPVSSIANPTPLVLDPYPPALCDAVPRGRRLLGATGAFPLGVDAPGKQGQASRPALPQGAAS